MANDQLFIPSKIKVGYQHRTDTYTKKLAYVIYYDQKGVLRKEKSWRSWIQDKPQQQWNGKGYTTVPGIPVDDFDNVPTEGFVLNKKAGGYSSGWNHRQTYCRVFDPRGFEFEITIPNLLYILQECNAYKGKGLEGEFVYAWDGTDLVLLPCSSPDYQQSQKFTKLQEKKVSAKELIEGATYLTKKQEELVFLGRFNWVDFGYSSKMSIKKNYIFANKKEEIVSLSSLANVAVCQSDTPVLNYAALVDKFIKSDNNADFAGFEAQDTKFSYDEHKEPYHRYGRDQVDEDLPDAYFQEIAPNEYRVYKVQAHWKNEQDSLLYTWSRKWKFQHYELTSAKVVRIEGGKCTIKDNHKDIPGQFTKEELRQMGFKFMYVKLKSGKTKRVNF